MNINYDKMDLTERRLTEIIGELVCQKEQTEQVIKSIRSTDASDSVVAELKRIKGEIESKILTVMKMKEAIKNIGEIYKSAESRIETFIEEGLIEKSQYKCCTHIHDRTDFEWSMK